MVEPPPTSNPDAAAGEAAASRFGWIATSCLILLAAVAVMLPADLTRPGRLSLFFFSFAVILWATTRLNPSYVAAIAAVLLVLTGGTPQERLFEALSSDVMGLMFGAFILGAALQRTGLAARLTEWVVGRARTVGGTFWLLTAMLIPLAMFIPSTTGRAAVALPVFKSIAGATRDPRISRALALLIPTVILVSTIGTLVGAGSHLIANDLLEQISGQRIGFLEWLVYGLPLAVVASGISAWVVQRGFLDRTIRIREVVLPKTERGALAKADWLTIGVTVTMLGLWVSERWHGYDIAVVAVAGALVLTLPRVGVLGWTEGLRAVSWNLVIFVGAALVLGRALIDSEVAAWIVGNFFSGSGLTADRAPSPFVILVLLLVFTLTSHLYMTSHSARAVALVPPLLALAASLQLDPVAVLFLSVAGMNYCLTFPVSSKALLVFQGVDEPTFAPADLLRLSALLLPIHFVLILVCYHTYWRWVGLQL